MTDAAVTTLFEPFDLAISLGPDSTPWLSASSTVGFVHGVPRRGAGLPDLQTLLDLVYDYADAVQFAEPDARPDLSRLLGDLVFGEPMVLQLFLATRGVAADKGRQTLVRILASPHLAVLPWELLPDPSAPEGREGHRYLALAPDAHVVRLARGRTYPSRVAPLEAPLNLLIVLSSPTPQDESEDWLAFDIFEVKRNLLAELKPLEDAGLLKVHVEDRPTLENLRRRIGDERRGFHLFHYVGHALPDRLILEDRAGRREDLTSARLVELLRLCPDLRLATFAGCETARAAGDPSALATRDAVGWRDLLSLADYCVQEACPTVLGMQAVLPFCTERLFTRFFYQGIATGYSVAEALRLARGAIQSDARLGGDLLDWSVPTLFVGAAEPGPVLPREAPPVPRTPRRRFELKLGLQQRAERFYARDLALRQAVDLLGGRTRERVLLLSGPDGVGKTSLVDRALEEVGDAASHVLYAHLNRLAPEIAAARDDLAARRGVNVAALSALPADLAAARLCRFVEELLRLSGAEARAKDGAWSTEEWWERLVEDMVRHRVLLVIDDLDVLDRMIRVLLAARVARWIAARVRDCERDGKSGELANRVDASLRLLDGAALARGETPFVTRDELRAELEGLPARVQEVSVPILRECVEWLLAQSEETVATLEGSFERFVELAVGDAANDVLVAGLAALECIREGLGRALTTLADRRSPGRVMITAREIPRGLLRLPDAELFEMRLGHLTWPETWRWIRRNLPGLVSFGDAYLSRLWARLGSRLEAWEELERRVLRLRGLSVDLEALADEVAPRAKAPPAAAAVGELLRTRGQRPLRVAAAGPHLASPSALAEAMTRLATEHGIGGRVVFHDPGEAGTLAVLIDEPSPFEKGETLATSDMVEWLHRVSARQPDIILLDYGGPADHNELRPGPPFTPHRAMMRKLQHRGLLVAAGGTEVDRAIVDVPAAFPEVLAVGALGNDGQRRWYSPWHWRLVKPDIFMLDDLAGSPLAAAIKPAEVTTMVAGGNWGTSFSSLHAVGAAVLVWSILPELSPAGVRALLVEAAKPIDATRGPRALALADAVALARRRVIERTLQGGPCSLETLSAMTGVELRAVAATIRSLLVEGRVTKLTSGRLERYQLA
jgi:hypothetical protein